MKRRVADTHLLGDIIHVKVGLNEILQYQTVQFIDELAVTLVGGFLLSTFFRFGRYIRFGRGFRCLSIFVFCLSKMFLLSLNRIEGCKSAVELAA